MLNGYHRQFLRHLDAHYVRFIVIGGQARWFLSRELTRDLDLWVDISRPNRERLECALIAWVERYPSHTRHLFRRPLPFRPNVQIHFPEDDATYLNENSELGKILSHDGIDILTSVFDFDFDEFWDRRHERIEDGIAFRALSKEDLDAILY